jgi:RNA polymerase sigma-70 factor (ECF subfamily)
MEDGDLAVVLRVRAGDSDGFRLLVERHSRSVFRLAYRMTGNQQDAEDIVQETFLRAYRQLHRYESRAGFGTWLYRIAANYALDLIRSRKRHAGAQPVAVESGADPRDPLLSVPSPEPGPERLTFNGQVQQHVTQALDALTAQERTAFVLRHIEGQSIDEISFALGIGGNAAKHSIFRAVRKMRLALEPFVES